jgi:hypothetical protein
MTDQRWIIPEKLFMGFHRNPRGHAPLATFTGAGTDSGSKGRMQTVSNNCTNTWTLDNTPQWGITVGPISWRDEICMEDPRGFSVSVRSDHVLQLMKECVVINGVIQSACVWARTNGQNMLLVVGSETHDVAQIQTRLAASKIPLKQVKLGDWITLQNGTQGVYLGKYHKVTFDTSPWVRSNRMNRLEVDATARMVIWQPVMKRSWRPTHTQSVLFLTNPVIAAHEPGETAYTEAEAELKLQELLHDPHCLVQRTQRGYHSERVILAARKMPGLDKLVIHKVPAVYASAEEAQAENHKVHWSPDGVNFWMWGHATRGNHVTVYKWDTASLAQHALMLVPQQVANSQSAVQQVLDVSTGLLNLYEFEVSYTSSLGNVLSGKA